MCLFILIEDKNSLYSLETKLINIAKLKGDNKMGEQGELIENNKALENNVSMDSIMRKIEDLERKIDSIFDGHVLINGEFKKITVLPNESYFQNS